MSKHLLHTYDMGEGVTAFSTTRHGGASQGAYAQFNINHYCGDDEAHIATNRQTLATLLGIDTEDIVLPHQTHGTEVLLISEAWHARPQADRQRELEGIDAVMTAQLGLCIGVSTADCIPILLHDPAHGAVAAIHAGWRGTVGRIAGKTVEAMRQAFATRPEALRAVIGPGISREAFEVGDEVYEQFVQAGFDMAHIAERRDRWHLDLPRCNQLQLIEAGVPTNQICPSGICTYRQADDYFSARRLGIASGRIYNGILLKT